MRIPERDVLNPDELSVTVQQLRAHRTQTARKARKTPSLLTVALCGAVLLGIWMRLAPLPHGAPSSADEGGLSFPGVAIAAYVAGGKAPPGGIPYLIEDKTGDGHYRVVRFRTAESGDLIAELYLPPDKRGSVRLRPGSYQVNIAHGRRWLGPDIHFGRGGRVYDFGRHDVGGSEAGISIAPASLTGTAREIAGSRF